MSRVRQILGIPITGWLCAGGSGLILTLGYAPFFQPVAAWIGLIPLAYYGQRQQPDIREAFLLGWFFGFSHFLTSLSWLQTVTISGWAVLSAYLAIYPALWLVLWVRLAGRDPDRMTSWGNIRHACLGASAWILTEWLRGVVLTGFGWNALGVSQGDLLLIAQVADLGGVLLVSWVVAFAGLTLALTARRFELEIRGSQKWRPRWDFTAGVLVVGLTMVYGARTLLRPLPESVVTLRYAAIQPSVPQDPWRAAKVARVAQELKKWSELALVGGGPVDLLVWPESLAGTGWREEPELQAAVQAVRQMGARALLTGSLDVRGPETFNCAILFQGSEGRPPEVYDKTHLVVMGEYVPLAGFFPWLRKLVPPGGDLTAGKNSRVLSLESPAIRLAPLICFEDAVPRVVRRVAQKLPHLLVNLTNDAWFGASAGSRQHLENARLRAVETRLPLLRVTNDGVTALISPRGVILAEVRDPKTGTVREPGFLQGKLELPEPKATAYTRWGEWPVWLSMGLVAVGLGWRREPA